MCMWCEEAKTLLPVVLEVLRAIVALVGRDDSTMSALVVVTERPRPKRS